MKLLPERLERWLATLETLERSDRMQMLIDRPREDRRPGPAPGQRLSPSH